MGMYTGLRFKGVVKEQFREGFEEIALDGAWGDSADERLRGFANDCRASFIPCGALSYMPWYDDDEEFARTYDTKTGVWTFQCSLKNYNDTIEAFLDLVPYFIENVEFCEVLYESWAWSVSYELVEGKMKERDEFICYADSIE